MKWRGDQKTAELEVPCLRTQPQSIEESEARSGRQVGISDVIAVRHNLFAWSTRKEEGEPAATETSYELDV
ncbi:unnamed protein product, partial [Iphiclides podalirius]